jgi:hypothetical protein
MGARPLPFFRIQPINNYCDILKYNKYNKKIKKIISLLGFQINKV